MEPTTAEAVLAEVQSLSAPEADGAAPATEPPGEDVSDVEYEEEGGEVQSLSWNDAMERVPPDIRRLMRQMQGDYTRKTQALAEQRKEVEEKSKKAEETLSWYKQNEASIDEYNKWKEDQGTEKPAVDDLYDGVDDYEKVKKLQEEYQKQLQKVQDDYTAAMRQGYEQIKALTEIKLADPDADWDKILTLANEKGIPDMRQAYNMCYEEKLTQKKIDEAVKKREKEIEEKIKADVMTTVTPLGRQSRQVIKPKDRR